MNEQNLASHSIATKLLFVIYLFLGISIITSISNIIEITHPIFHNRFQTSLAITSIIGFINLIVMVIFAIIWIYRTHKDLETLFPDYPITPKESLKMMLIPFYNLWGLWNMAKSAFDIFKMHGFSLKWNGLSLQAIYLCLIVIGFIDRTLTRSTFGPSYANLPSSEKLIYQIIWGVISILTPILWYGIVTLVEKALYHIVNEQNAS